MRIAWLSPYSQKSAIARFSRDVVSELSELASVDLWHPATADPWPSQVSRISFESALAADISRLSEYDCVVYNIGNYLPFHRDIYQLASRVPGIVVMHDFVMHHFFASYYFEYLKQPDGYIRAMEHWYGERGRAVAAATVSGERQGIWEADDVVDFPLFEQVLQGAYGVIAHSNFLCDRIRRIFSGPVCKIPLAYEVHNEPATTTSTHLGIPSDRLLLVTVGHVNRNKRIHSVIQALGRLGDRARGLVYAVLGPCSEPYEAELNRLVEAGNLHEVVRRPGYVTDEVLHSYMRRADICINLRFPAIEGASASAIEAMWHGKPIVVSNTGFYAELPDDVAFKISIENEVDDLTAALSRLLDDAELRKGLGANALALAGRDHHGKRYASEFLKFVHEVRKARPALEFADRLGGLLKGMGAHSNMKIVDTAIEEASSLFFNDDSVQR